MIVKAGLFQTERRAFFMPAFISSFMLAGIENRALCLQI